MTRLTPESVREMLAPERANLAWPTDVASDIARAYLDAIAEVDAMRTQAAAYKNLLRGADRRVEDAHAEERAARDAMEAEHRAHCERLTADVGRLTRERDALAARVIEEHATYDALRADRDRLRRDLDARIHGPAGRLYTSED